MSRGCSLASQQQVKVLNCSFLRCERTFGHLKGRFRRLKALDMLLIAEISEVIMICCILNNFLLIHDGDTDVDDFMDLNDNSQNGVAIEEADARGTVLRAATNKRDLIARTLNPRRHIVL